MPASAMPNQPAQPTRSLALAPPEPASSFDDPIGPLILQSGFVSSYAETNRFTRAHEAAADLAAGETVGGQYDHFSILS